MRLLEPSASVRLRDGTVAERPLLQLTAGEVTAAAPWRSARSARGQAHYPGYYWSATSGGHVIYESRLELARLLLADFDPGVTAIAAQPFLLRAQAGARLRWHVPDFLLVRSDHTVQVVNVKPAARLADPVVAEALAWPGPLFEARGWDHEIWTGASPVLLENVRRSYADRHMRSYADTRLRQDGILEPVTAAICQFARKLDQHGTPIDYARRRRLRRFSEARLDTDSWRSQRYFLTHPATWAQRRHPGHASPPAAPVQEQLARLRLIELLTGTHPRYLPEPLPMVA